MPVGWSNLLSLTYIWMAYTDSAVTPSRAPMIHNITTLFVFKNICLLKDEEENDLKMKKLLNDSDQFLDLGNFHQ